MDLEPPEDSQDIQVISVESDYWQRFEEEVHFNRGRTPTWEHTPRYLMETICEEPMDTNTTVQPDSPEYEGEGRLVIDTEAAGEYIEEFHDNQKGTKTDGRNTPLDLTTRMEAGEQSRQSIEDMDNTSCQASVEDNSELPTEAELEAEIERVKEGVVENHLLYNQWKRWECRACEHICDAPYRLREQILSCHFEGQL